jgi:predicted Zn-ribbon and HTH transcriptional regulator
MRCRHFYQIKTQQAGYLLIKVKKCVKCGYSLIPEFVKKEESYDIKN